MTIATRPLDIAIIGMAARVPGANDVRQFWRNLCNGVESITRFTGAELKAAGVSDADLADTHYVKAGGTMAGYEYFDSGFFEVNLREADIMDPQQRIFLECAWEALDDAGYGSAANRGSVGVFAGTGANTYFLQLQGRHDLIEALASHARLTNEKDYLTTRVSYKLDLRGPSIGVQTACSTSLVAVHLASMALVNGECDLAMAGGSSLLVYNKGYQYKEGGVYDPSGHCRAFDDRAAGTVPGDGAGVVVLKPLKAAERDGDHIYAVIKGSAINNDGSSKLGYTAPSIPGQTDVIRRAHASAGAGAPVGYVETHGTATPLGDLVEAMALWQALSGANRSCRIGSVKSNIGHLDTASGVAGLIKAALCVKHGLLPPTLHVERPNSRIDFKRSPLVINTALTPWSDAEGPRRAGVSSFGIGGTNAHVVVEQPPLDERVAPDVTACQLLPLSARTRGAVEEAAQNLARHLAAELGLSLADVAFTLQKGRQSFQCRRAYVCKNVPEAIEALQSPIHGAQLGSSSASKQKSVAFLFPGQGTQSVNMGRELYVGELAFRAHVDRCAEIVRAFAGYDIREVLYPDGDIDAASEQMARTSRTQLALFVVESALAVLWQQWGVRPQAVIGHSAGEYAAAYVAGVFDLDQALRLLWIRGELMEETEPGAMLVVMLPESMLAPMLGDDLSLAAVNAPRQCVVSGSIAAVEAFQGRLTDQQHRSMRLPAKRAFHSALLDGIAGKFRSAFHGITLRRARIPFVSNLTGTWMQEHEVCDPNYWVRQLRSTVRFGPALHQLIAKQHLLLEVGPGQTLSALAAQCGGATDALPAICSLDEGSFPARESMMRAAGRLWLAAVELNWSGLHPDGSARRVPLPSYPFERKRHWIGKTPGSAAVQTNTSSAKRPMEQWFYVPKWIPSTLAAAPAVQKPCVVFVDADEICIDFANRCRNEGRRVISVRPGAGFTASDAASYEIVPGSAQHYRDLFQQIFSSIDGPLDIFYMWGLNDEKAGSAEAQDWRPFSRLLWLLKAVAANAGQRDVTVTVLTRNATRVDAADDVMPERAALSGLCVVASQEHPNIFCRTIDVRLPVGDRRKNLALDAVFRECSAAAGDRAVAYRGSARWVQSFAALALGESVPARSVLKHGGGYLIIGGLSRVGITLAEHLASRFSANLALTTRFDNTGGSASQSKLRALDRVDALRKAGSDVIVQTADPTVEHDIRAAIAQAKDRFGTLNGIIYSAGHSGHTMFCSLADMDRDHYEAHFTAKARGVQVLEQALHDVELDFCMVMSSLASVLGGLGFAAYAAANLFSDAVVWRNSRGPTPWVSVNWDAWQADTPQQQASSIGLTQFAMTPGEGSEAFLRIMSSVDIPQVVVSTGDLIQRLEKWTGAPTASATEGNLHDRPQAAGEYHAPQSQMETVMAEEWRRVLGIGEIGVADNFFALGGDSLLATHMLSGIQKRLGVQLGLREFFEQPTIRTLAEIATRQSSGSGKTLSSFAAETTTIDAVLHEIGSLSENGTEVAVQESQKRSNKGTS